MPGSRRAHHLGWLGSWLAIWFAALLAIGPLAHPPVPGAPVWTYAGPSHSSVSADDGLSESQEPASALRTGPSAPPGVLSRLSLIETTLGLPPVKSPLLKPSAVKPPLVPPRATARREAVTDHVFHRSSVGTARTPTGPPL